MDAAKPPKVRLIEKRPVSRFVLRIATYTLMAFILLAVAVYAFNAAHVIEDDVAYALYLYAGFGIEVSAFVCGVTLVWRIVFGWFSAGNSN